MAERVKQPIGKLLIDKGVISEDQLRIALIEQKREREPLGKLLVGKVDGESVLGSRHPLTTALEAAGFRLTPRGLVLRR